MTDSMKFGPEWLRNLSTDSSSTALSSSGGSNGNGNNSSLNITSPIIANSNLNHGNISNAQLPGQQRSLFPQFRYGREELLSLFDKNCNLPEILPGYKKLFVDKVQVPLALTPSTDEEVFTQAVAPPTQRPTWIRRSPIGFPPSSRGSGRGGSSVDRGRIRGKPAYHTVYQRITSNMATYDDSRTPLIKPERGWAERNGVAEGSDGGFASVGIVTEWIGTPASSPRKEQSSHSRTTENWRKNRTEDGSADSPSSVIIGAEGWRGSSFGSHKWGRSTSWRDEDSTPSASAEAYGGSVASLQRSFSTISSSTTERGGYGGGNNISKNSSISAGLSVGVNQSGSRQIGANSGTSVGSRNNQWTTSSGDSADDLPEWAMENPSDSGGTFDASGAFHGSLDYSSSVLGSKNYACLNGAGKETNGNISQKCVQINVMEEKEIHPDQNCQKTYVSEEPRGEKDLQPLSDFDDNDGNEIHTTANVDKKSENDPVQCVKSETNAELSESISSSIEVPALPTEGIKNEAQNEDIGAVHRKPSITHRKISQSDLSDLMQEVADDMVEKLIMDDDTEGIKNAGGSINTKNISSVPVTSVMNIPNAFVVPAVAAILKQTGTAQQHASANIGISSPSLTTMAANQKVMPLFGSGLVVDNATMHQHHLQQQQLAAASASASLHSTMNSTTSVDLWYYRDPQSKVQGPFTAIEMTEWYRAGYFDENLFVRRVCDSRFRALGELIKLCQGNMPFTHTHLIPLGLDNVNLVPNSISDLRQVRDKQNPASNDYAVNQQQQQEHREELKGNVTAAADSLNAAVKNLINPVDMSHILNMHFQMLQEQYLRHQEMLVVTEYSAKECFQRLTPSEREAVVRQKVQMLRLPEYLTSLAGLSNSLATLNLSAGSQLYDFIAECSKKDQHFSNNPAQMQSSHHPTQLPMTNSFLDCDDFLANAQKQQAAFANVTYGGIGNTENETGPNIGNDDVSPNDLINDFNLRILLSGNNIHAQNSQQHKTQATPEYENDFLTQQQLMAVASQSPSLQMWMPQLTPNNNVQQQFISQQAPTQVSNNQWNGNTIAQLPNTAIVGTSTIPRITPVKSMPSSMWEILPMEQSKHQYQPNAINFDVQNHTTPQLSNINKEQQARTCAEPEKSLIDQTQTSPTHSIILDVTTTTLSPTQQPTGCGKQHKEDITDKLHHHQQLQLQQVSSNKRVNSKSQTLQTSRKEGKEENTINKKCYEDERRRETAEEKRRQKDEKKRHQAEEEKRRLQLIEEEKNRQILEEKERQQKIQAQRRKALLGSVSSGNASSNTTCIKTKEQRIQSSVAPWSSQSAATFGNSGPSLAEIQKAERRERRADQQRQMEILEKQMRSNSATVAENNDAFLKWNASPVPVKSLAQIQAEESKRLAVEQLEIQRRKEQEQSNIISSNSGIGAGSNVGTGASSHSLSTIWSGSKVWGSTSNAGFWEEPIKFSAALVSTPASNSGSAFSSVGKPQSPLSQQKLQNNQHNVIPALSSNRNLTKSQTVTTMQNAHFPNPGSNKNNQYGVSVTFGINPQKQQLKPNFNAIEKKSGNGKSQPSHGTHAINSSFASSNKKDDYQNEFTGWCMKSLGGMNTKVDVPTFVTFLQDLESPYEVKDYVRMYLGKY